MSEDDFSDIIRPVQARALLCVSRSWLYHHTKDGTIPSFRIGGSNGPLRYSRRALQALMVPQEPKQ